MGKGLQQVHRDFFIAKMEEHSRVTNWVPIQDEHDYLFRITRRLSGQESNVIVHLTDAYRYGFADFFAKPGKLRRGISYVVIGMPHASIDPEVIERAKIDRIGIGKVGKFMGALNYRDIWTYLSPDERQQKKEERRPRQAES